MSNTIETINPSTGKVIATYNSMSTEEVNQRTKNARIAFENWRRIDISERCTYMRRLGRVMKKNKEDYAKLITEEMG
ncbi:MAG TPA: aldehyde dehydrogenase family protein, partial [Nitrososphaeraceae archaeon]|nr:aldehyde dehydrogenase family protein [Nitrososphaeraceae archaeon]